MRFNMPRLFVCAVLFLLLSAYSIQAGQEAAIWISPATYTGTTGQNTVEARAAGIDADGKPVDTSLEWMPTDPAMVTVSPSRGKEVTIIVHRAGESILKVTSLGFSRKLFIKAKGEGKTIRLEITSGQAPAAVREKTGKDVISQKEKLSYSLGYNYGSQLKRQSVDVHPDTFTTAFREGIAGNKAAVNEQEMRETLSEFQKEMRARQSGKKTDAAEGQKQYSENSRPEGEAFLNENAKKEGVVTLPSGLQYKIIKPGDGRQPGKADTVKVHYRGTLVNGTEFDSSYKRGNPATFGVGNVIKGWAEALQLMKEGSKWMLYIPSELAYGKKGAGRGKKKIGPNQTLIFEVELLSVNPAAVPQDSEK